ncbi:MAG: hypothetical protein Q4G40_01800 [Brachybacterium sp.]|nr:hypothetical protein [Brachybacterium sp.]
MPWPWHALQGLLMGSAIGLVLSGTAPAALPAATVLLLAIIGILAIDLVVGRSTLRTRARAIPGRLLFTMALGGAVLVLLMRAPDGLGVAPGWAAGAVAGLVLFMIARVYQRVQLQFVADMHAQGRTSRGPEDE